MLRNKYLLESSSSKLAAWHEDITPGQGEVYHEKMLINDVG